MRIAIDITHSKKIKTGISTYTDNIINNLKIIDKKNRYFYFAAPSLFKKKFFIARFINALIDIVWRQVILPIELLFKKIDVYYSPAYYSPIFSPSRVVVVIHDLIFLKFRKEYPLLWYYYLKLSTKISIKNANTVIVPSQHTKKDILENYKNINSDKIKVIYEAPGNNFKIIEDQSRFQEFRNKYNLRNKFLLYVGGLTLHKNIKGLLTIFAKFKRSQNNFENEKYSLVIAGSKNPPENIKELIEKLGLEKDIIFLGFIPENDLASLYNIAELLLFPSLYEGFGLPPIEAMSCGCPVISSNLSSLPEVMGEAGISTNPENIEEFVKSINLLLENKDFKDKLARKGLERVKNFSWGKTAQETLDIFNST